MPSGKYFMKQVSKLDKELKQELEWLNENLKAVVTNQAMLYLQLQKIADELADKKIDSP